MGRYGNVVPGAVSAVARQIKPPTLAQRPKLMRPAAPTTPTTSSVSVPEQAQAQGRDVVSQGGQQGVVGRGGNFQPLGAAALSRLGGAGGGAGPGAGVGGVGGNMAPDLSTDWKSILGDAGRMGADASAGTGGATGVGDPAAGAGDIQGAIQGLKSQLGMPADAAINKMAGFGPGVQTGTNASGMPASGPGSMASYLPQGAGDAAGAGGDYVGRLRSMVSDGLRGGQGTQQMQAGGGGFMPGQPNPYAAILRQRLSGRGGAGAVGATMSALGGGGYA